ncbi:MAG: efflux RND transporter periplasmic adaptor subunit [Planctomycetes bacterium]|nr:efflux RND transporter periplasmic adaptor subunit [Planctomycetota bacterium]
MKMLSECALARVWCLVAVFVWIGCGDKGGSEKGHAHDHDEHGHEPGAHADEADEHGHGEEEHEGHSDEVTLAASQLEQYGIRVETVGKRTLVPTVLVPAQVAFNREAIAHVGSPVRGRISEVLAKVGQDVKQGERLLTIESPELGEAQSEYLQKRAFAKTAGPIVDLSKDAFERAKALLEKSQGITLTEVQKREGDFRTAEAELRNAETARDAARNRLTLLGMNSDAVARLEESNALDPRFAITAPISGQVIEREATLGELVGPDRERLLAIADLSKLWVLGKVPEAKLRRVSVGSKARVLLGAAAGHWCEGKVVYVSPSLDVRTRTVDVRIEAEDRHPELRPGLFAQAEIELAPEHDAGATEQLVVPEGAVMVLEGATTVFVPVEGEEGAFTKRLVAVGESVGGFRPVFSGLALGESVVVSGTFLLKAELGKGSAAHEH